MTVQESHHETWFYRGREARGRGKPREISDGRLTLANRQSWYEGWDEEDRLRAPKPPPEQIAQFNSFLADLANQVRKNIKP